MEAKGVMGSVCTVLELYNTVFGIAQKVDSEEEKRRNDATIRIVRSIE